MDLEGRHLQKFSDGPQWDDDGFAGIRPLVVIDGSMMLISWGNAVPPNLTGRVDTGQRVYRVPITGRDDISVWGTSASLRTADLWRFYYSYRTLIVIGRCIC